MNKLKRKQEDSKKERDEAAARVAERLKAHVEKETGSVSIHHESNVKEMFDTDIHHLIKDTGFFLVLLEVSELEEIDVREFVPLLIMDAMHMMQVNSHRWHAAGRRFYAIQGQTWYKISLQLIIFLHAFLLTGFEPTPKQARDGGLPFDACRAIDLVVLLVYVVDIALESTYAKAYYETFRELNHERGKSAGEMHHENIEREEKKKDAQAEANAARVLGRTKDIIREDRGSMDDDESEDNDLEMLVKAPSLWFKQFTVNYMLICKALTVFLLWLAFLFPLNMRVCRCLRASLLLHHSARLNRAIEGVVQEPGRGRRHPHSAAHHHAALRVRRHGHVLGRLRRPRQPAFASVQQALHGPDARAR